MTTTEVAGTYRVTFTDGATRKVQATDKTAAGVIAIQMHMGQPMDVQVRNIKLKVQR